MKKIIICIGLIALFFSQVSAQVNTNKFGKGFDVVGKDSSFTMNIGMRFQSLYTNNWDVRNDELGDIANPTSNFLLRRSRLKFKGFVYNPKVQYKMEFGLTNRDLSGGGTAAYSNSPRLILDAVIKWNFYKNFTLWAGQTKLPGNRERVISSANMETVDRSRLNSKFNLDRDMGVQLRHKMKLGEQFILKEAFAFSQGEGRNITSGNIGGHDYTFRVEMLPMGEFTSKGDYKGGDLKRETKPKLAIGLTYDINDRAGRERGQGGDFIPADESQLKRMFAFFGDFMYKYKGFSMMGEYANKTVSGGDNNVYDATNTVLGTYCTGEAASIQAGYLFKSNWQPVVRFTHISPTSSNKENEFTLGVSKYIVGHKLKVQSDISYREVGGNDDLLFYRLQFDLHF
ncbi:OprO/OprP family phosphate-selective porin [Flavobacteriales bacterium]|nr:OprO/OprP family phosphate-selective porin [Flavobacteriales bacterium]